MFSALQCKHSGTTAHVQYSLLTLWNICEVKDNKCQKRNESLTWVDEGVETVQRKKRTGEEKAKDGEFLNGSITVSCCYFHF